MAKKKRFTKTQRNMLERCAVPGLSVIGTKCAETMKAALSEIDRMTVELKECTDSLKAYESLMKVDIDILKLHREENDDLKGRIAELEADAADQLQDRAEVVGELQKRAVPKGWQVQVICKPGVHIHRIVGKGPESWFWNMSHTKTHGTRFGEVNTLAEAVAAVEEVFAKRKAALNKAKVRR